MPAWIPLLMIVMALNATPALAGESGASAQDTSSDRWLTEDTLQDLETVLSHPWMYHDDREIETALEISEIKRTSFVYRRSIQYYAAGKPFSGGDVEVRCNLKELTEVQPLEAYGHSGNGQEYVLVFRKPCTLREVRRKLPQQTLILEEESVTTTPVLTLETPEAVQRAIRFFNEIIEANTRD